MSLFRCTHQHSFHYISFVNIFKSLIAVAAVAATSLAAVEPAAARDADSAEAYSQNQLVQVLERAGVTITDGDCESGYEGWYYPASKHIVICNGAKQPWEVLRHEAVHAAQHCAGRLNDNDAITPDTVLANRATKRDWEHIKSAYPKIYWEIELEAFTYMRYSNAWVSDFVSTHCG